MRATEFILNEVGDNPYTFEPYQPPNQQHIKVRARNAIDKIPPNKNTTTVANPNIKNYSFVTKNGLRYVVILKPSTPNSNGEINTVELAFYAIDKKGRANFDITGTGDAANVFATVKNVLTKYIEEYNPKLIGFSSEKKIDIAPNNDSRFKLYSLFAKQFSKWFPAYTKSYTRDEADRTVFMFKRNDTEQVTEQENPKVDLTPNYPNYQMLVGEFIGVKKNRLRFKILSAELKPGQGETEIIRRAVETNTPISIEINRVKNRNVVEDISRRGFLGGLAAMGAGMSQANARGMPLKPKVVQPSEQPINLISMKDTEAEKLLHRAALKAGIKGVELAQFLAQARHESDDFSKMKEHGGNKYFSKLYDPKLSPKTAKILGNTKIGDGVRYHGRGFIQITGRDNYRMAGKSLGLPLEEQPDLAARPDIAAKIAIWYWNTRVKPYINNFNDTKAVTQKINPAMRGLKDRHAKFIDYKNIL